MLTLNRKRLKEFAKGANNIMNLTPSLLLAVKK